jgi:DNA/RNA non-specific endonuclease
LSSFNRGEADAPWEGIGTGWFTSVLGGGSLLRRTNNPTKADRSLVGEDNNKVALSQRGDYAVPTLFNGNFDAISRTWATAGSTQRIAGWSIGDADVQQQYLDRNQPGNSSLALKLGGKLNEISHDPFVVPDWGALRFDLHIPKIGGVSQLSDNNPKKFTVSLIDANGTTVVTQPVLLQAAKGTAAAYSEDRWRIGYGETGFETFTIDVPDALRGKVATLKFVLDGGGEVYIDNVFFKSQHLLLGNPTEARNPDAGSSGVDSYKNNYLLEKSQFTASYSENDNIPNWSAWQLNRNWTGNEDRPSDYFFGAPVLDALDWTQVFDTDYRGTYPDGTPKANLPQLDPQGKPYKL